MTKIHTQSYVTLSDLFDGLDVLCTLFKEADHSKITWGGANRTMIDTAHFDLWHALDHEEIQEEGAEDEYEVLVARIKELPEGVLVDLEN